MQRGMKTRLPFDVHAPMNTKPLLLALALAVLSQGCIVVGDDGGDPYPPPSNPPPSNPTPVPPDDDGVLIIDNDSSFDLYEIYVTPVDVYEWGPDQLAGDILRPDESLTLDVGCDYYDALLVDEFGHECEILDLDVCYESLTLHVTDDMLADCGGFGHDSELRIENESSVVIESIYVAQIDSSSWGPDLLGGEILFPGEGFTIELGCDAYNVMVVDELGTECMLESLDLCFEDATWFVTNSQLAGCEFISIGTAGVTRQEAQPEQRESSANHGHGALPQGDLL
jgi:hypothetical protein